MRLTVLGNNGPYPSAGGACSGYLLEDGGQKVLLDCGNGVLSNLFKFIRFDELDAIILTHLHSDHMSDMMVLRYAVDIMIRKGFMSGPLDVFAPDQPSEEFSRLDIKSVFNLKPIAQDVIMNIGSMRFTFAEMKHPVKCCAVSVESGGKRFVFSGDTAWTENIINFSKDADVLMLDCGLMSKDKLNDNVPHLTARECGIAAKEAAVKKLLLTHFWPEYDLDELLAEARENFDNAELTRLLSVYHI